MAEFEYEGFAYRQSSEDVPWIISVVVPAEELLEWAGIPRRSDHAMQGFQRVQDESRVEKARVFFSDPHNQSPTSLIVGLHPTSDSGGSVEIVLEDSFDDESPLIRKAHVTVTTSDDLDLSEVADVVRNRLAVRIDADTASQEQAREDEYEDEFDVSEPEQEGDDYAADEDEGTVHVGRSVLRELVKHLEDDAWIADAEEDLRALAKPATIIDGQHRVLGAARLEQSLPFSTLLLADCPWSEQVFQFTVVNYTATGIPDQFITANAALSLTEQELLDLQSRLNQAGVKVLEYELMRTVHFDPNSPFFELVNLSEKRQKNLIGYKTMVRIARSWYAAKRPFFSIVLEEMYPDIKGQGKVSRRRKRWQEGDWAKFFLAFWNLVHEHYKNKPSHVEGAKLWDVGSSQLVVAAVLERLQENFFENLDLQDEVVFQLNSDLDSTERVAAMREVFSGRATKYLEWLPSEFFATQWGITSLNTGAGKQALDDVIQNFVRRKGKYAYGQSPLVQGKTT